MFSHYVVKETNLELDFLDYQWYQISLGLSIMMQR